MNKIRAHVVISGIVQGVYFRCETYMRARSLSVDGWVRNNPCGTVEAVFEGEKRQVEDMISWCRRGPRGAVVSDISVKRSNYTGGFKQFSIR